MDELAAPFGYWDLAQLLGECAALSTCGGISLNWRLTHGHGIAPPRNVSVLQAAEFDVGILNPHVKSVVRVERVQIGGSFRNPHAVDVSKPYCIMDENLTCTPHKRNGAWRVPPRSRLAVLLHLQCTNFLDWTFKKSLRGRADTKDLDDNSDLGQIHEEYVQACSDPASARHSTDRWPFHTMHKLPRLDLDESESQLQNFLIRMDRLTTQSLVQMIAAVSNEGK